MATTSSPRPSLRFPIVRNQEKYQLRYDVSHATGDHCVQVRSQLHSRAGAERRVSGQCGDAVHVPAGSDVLYAIGESRRSFRVDYADGAQFTPASDGSFSQNVQRLALYAQDSWRVTPHLTFNYGLRYQTTFGLFTASGRSQLDNPAS